MGTESTGMTAGTTANSLQIRLASDGEKLAWSFGRVVADGDQPGGLCDPRIFGHNEDYRCLCGTLTGRKNDGAICDRCGVVLGVALVQRTTRCGHIQLAAPVRHPWDRNQMFQVLCVIPIELRSLDPTKWIARCYASILQQDTELRALCEASGKPSYVLIRDGQHPFGEIHGRLQSHIDALIGTEDGGFGQPCLGKLLSTELRKLGSNLLAYARGVGIAFTISARI